MIAKRTRLLACGLLSLAPTLAAAQSASFDAGSNTLNLPYVRITGNVAYQDVVVGILDFGTLRVDDPAVGASNEFDPAGSVLRLPLVRVGGVDYPRVSLTRPVFAIKSVGSVVADAGSGNWALDLTVSAVGVPVPPVRITNVPKPTTRDEFCSVENTTRRLEQTMQGVSGSWSITGCSFSGNSGSISAVLSISSPIAMTVPYTAQYTYVPM